MVVDAFATELQANGFLRVGGPTADYRRISVIPSQVLW